MLFTLYVGLLGFGNLACSVHMYYNCCVIQMQLEQLGCVSCMLWDLLLYSDADEERRLKSFVQKENFAPTQTNEVQLRFWPTSKPPGRKRQPQIMYKLLHIIVCRSLFLHRRPTGNIWQTWKDHPSPERCVQIYGSQTNLVPYTLAVHSLQMCLHHCNLPLQV